MSRLKVVVDIEPVSEEAVAVLEEFLAEARAGLIRDVAVVAVQSGSTSELAFGVSAPTFQVLGGLHYLADEVATRIRDSD